MLLPRWFKNNILNNARAAVSSYSSSCILHTKKLIDFYKFNQHFLYLWFQSDIFYLIGAADRNRTGTGITTRGILSPLRLPVPPPRQT